MAETLHYMAGRVREVKASVSQQQAVGFLNRRISSVIDKRTWADSLRIGTVLLPGIYNTGTIDLTLGSSQIAGHGVVWPVNDRVNTLLVNPIVDLGYVDDITPASMAGISVGVYLTIEPETPNNMEIVPVMAVGPATFKAYIRKQHDPNVSIISSSFSGRQFNSNDYVYTIQSVIPDPFTPPMAPGVTASLLQVDQPWGSVSIVGQQYQIMQAYAQVTPFTKRMLYGWDPVAGSSLGIGKTWDILNLEDPQRTSTGDPEELVSMPPSPSGVMQWEVWPWQDTPRALNVVTSERWPKLEYDTDLSPWFINAEVFIAGACADALLTKTISREGRTDPYYDPQAAQYWMGEYSKLVEEAEQSDEGRYLKSLMDYEAQARNFNGNAHWLRTHISPNPWGSIYGY